MPNTLLYIRASTDKQEASPVIQEAELRRRHEALAGYKSLPPISGVYVDAGVSGSIAFDQRPAGKRLLNEVRRDDLVMVSKCDRLGRDTLDTLITVKRLEQAGVRIYIFDLFDAEYDSRSIFAEIMLTMATAFARAERRKISDRMTGWHGYRKRNGLKPTRPYEQIGYKLERNEQGKLVMVPDEDEQRVMTTILTLASKGFSVDRIWKLVRDEPRRRVRLDQKWNWSKKTIRAVLGRSKNGPKGARRFALGLDDLEKQAATISPTLRAMG